MNVSKSVVFLNMIDLLMAPLLFGMAFHFMAERISLW